MRRFTFRLERVLKLKQQRERLAELRLLQARLALDVVKARLVQLHEQLNAVAAGMGTKLGGPATAAAWLAVSAKNAQLTRALQQGAVDEERAQARLKEAAAERSRCAAETEALVRLRARAFLLHREEATAAEQRNIDELGLRLWRVGQGDGPSGEPTPEGEER